MCNIGEYVYVFAASRCVLSAGTVAFRLKWEKKADELENYCQISCIIIEFEMREFRLISESRCVFLVLEPVIKCNSEIMYT